MARKAYIPVNVRVDADGKLIPLSIEWENGVIYKIDRITDTRRAASVEAGGMGIRYTIVVNGKTSYLFYENPKWFVEAKR